MKKGFTLIELLAVIVILAIIALIATPIILGIINDARKESNERSVELYASAVRNAIASYQLTHPKSPTKFSDLDVEYDGEVECAKEELYADGSFYITDCTAKGDAVDYTYGRKKYEPQYYSWSFGKIGEDLPIDAKSTVSEIDTKGNTCYLGLDVDSNNKVTAAYACFVRNETEYCLKAKDKEAFYTNTEIVKETYSDVVDTDSCSFSDVSSQCSTDGWNVYASKGGIIGITHDDDMKCYIMSSGKFVCH